MKLLYLFFIPLTLIACHSTSDHTRRGSLTWENPPVYEKSTSILEIKEDRQKLKAGKKHNQSLSAYIYRFEGHDIEFRIKRNFNDAWELVGKAIMLNQLPVTGKNRKEGYYKIAYKSDGLFDDFAFFGKSVPSAYLVMLTYNSADTSVTISQIEDDSDDDPSRLKDGAPDYTYDNSARLSETLYQSLKNYVQP